MYDLKEAGVIAFDQLVHYLSPHGYEPAPCTPGLWRHTTRPTTFTLCVDNFGVNCFPNKTCTALLMRSRPTTKSPHIGTVPCTADSPWTRTTPRVMSSSACLATSSVPYKNLVIPSQNFHSTLLTNGLSQSTSQHNNSNKPPSPPPDY